MNSYYLELIENELLANLKSENKISYSFCLYQIETGGKRLRALLPLKIFQFLDLDIKQALNISLASEYLHQASLILDDIQDGDRFRKNKETLWSKCGIPHAANTALTLTNLANTLILKSNIEAANKEAILLLLQSTTLNVIEGQNKEESFKNHLERCTLSDYYLIANLKTSSYFYFPILSAIILTNKLSNQHDIIQTAITEIGICFQIQDDINDFYSEKRSQDIGSDLKEGKPNFLFILLLANCNTTEKNEFLTITSKPRDKTTNDDIEFVLSLFKKYKIKEQAIETINQKLNSVLSYEYKDTNLKNLITIIIQLLQLFVTSITAK